MNAIDFGLNLDSKGFNIFVLGENGTGKSTTIKSILNKKAAEEPVPTDWCYVYNFKDPDIPLAISMEPGRASVFHKDMEELIKILRVEIPKIFESKEYEKQKEQDTGGVSAEAETDVFRARGRGQVQWVFDKENGQRADDSAY